MLGLGFGPPGVVVAAAHEKLFLLRGSKQIELAGHTQAVFNLLTDRQGRVAVSASDDGTVRVWPLEAGGLEQLVCATTHRDLTAAERGRLGEHGRRKLCPTLAP